MREIFKNLKINKNYEQIFDRQEFLSIIEILKKIKLNIGLGKAHF